MITYTIIALRAGATELGELRSGQQQTSSIEAERFTAAVEVVRRSQVGRGIIASMGYDSAPRTLLVTNGGDWTDVVRISPPGTASVERV